MTLSGEELAVDKVLAIFGRAFARDFIDLLALEPRYGLERLCHMARQKDTGFIPAVFAEMLSTFHRLRRDEFELDDPGYERLRQQVALWHDQALGLSVFPERTRAKERDLGLGL